jgi:prepilin-type processing-associated H-X9-DG protein
MKAGTDEKAAHGKTQTHIEPLSYCGSCSALGDQKWIVPYINTVFALPAPVKLADINKPYCFPLLNEANEAATKGRNCFRWGHLQNATQNPLYRRHFGGTSLRANGVNFLFADGHAQWNSASFIATRMLCCADFSVLENHTAFTKNPYCHNP